MCSSGTTSLSSGKPLISSTDAFVFKDEIEIYNYLKQSHISKKNIARLKILASTNNSRISELAQIVLEVAEIKPYKKRRLKVLDRERRDLLNKLEETGLIYAHHYY